MIYDDANILSTYSDCDACNKICYKITECADPSNPAFVPLIWATDNPIFATYVGSVINFTTIYVWLLSDDVYWEFKPVSQVKFDECVIAIGINPITDYAAFEAWVLDPANLAWIQGHPDCFVQSAVDKCGLVEEYICRTEDIWLEAISVLDCKDSCEDCVPTSIEDSELVFKQRKIKPGYDVDCNDMSKTCDDV